jgi:hypothetical protein
VESESYSDQLIAALQQLPARVIEARAGQHGEQEREAIEQEFPGQLLDALGIAYKWSGARRPPFPAGADLAQLGQYAGEARDALGLEIDLVEAVHAISQHYAVEAIDNAIRVAESQA